MATPGGAAVTAKIRREEEKEGQGRAPHSDGSLLSVCQDAQKYTEPSLSPWSSNFWICDLRCLSLPFRYWQRACLSKKLGS